MQFTDIENDLTAKIKVIGCGGGGGNAVNNMIQSALNGVDFIVCNTDAQDINNSLAECKLHIGQKVTKGLGAGANPDIGREAALESMEEIKAAIGDADMVFVTAGMGGGTGTGAAPVVAEAAKEAGALVVGVVTKPFYFEGRRRMSTADDGIKKLSEHVDSIITIPNDRLLQLAAKKAGFKDMLRKADEILYYATKGIADLITVHGLINLDFADVKAVMSNSGLALMGTGISSGDGRAKDAALKAITSPLLEDVSINGAQGVLINITCSEDMLIDEASEAAEVIYSAADPNANIFFGTVFDDSLGDEMRVTVIATGIAQAGIAAVPNETHAQQTGRASKVIGIEDINRNMANQPLSRRILQRGRPGENADIPAYMRLNKRAEGETENPTPKEARRAANMAGPGETQFIFAEDDLDAPAFLRKNQN
ncbi:MAG: cell division protein FtsZ [Desulfovibrionaceae bacterium]|jgi:cell division protein FtsZ